jgi:uncharacterized protein YegP (UPF0339 family)
MKKNKRPAEFVTYMDATLYWRWRLIAPNGRIISDSAEAYSTRAHVKRAVRQIIAAVVGGAVITDELPKQKVKRR